MTGKATLPREYPGDPRLFVPVVRTSLVAGESLHLDAVVMGMPDAVAVFYWRPLGGKRFRSVPLTHVDRGVYRTVLPAARNAGGF